MKISKLDIGFPSFSKRYFLLNWPEGCTILSKSFAVFAFWPTTIEKIFSKALNEYDN